MPLNQSLAQKAQYDPTGPSQQIIWDRKVTGLGLRVYPSGKRSYVLSYRAGGRKRLMVLGSAGTLTLKQARDRATKKLADVIERKDPLDEKRHSQLRRFDEFSQEYVKHIRAKGVKSWRSRERLIVRFLSSWSARDILSITREDVARLHHKLGTDSPGRPGTPYLANRMVSLLRHMFSLAVTLAGYPEGQPNPATRIPQFKEHSRKRRVEPEELPKLVKAIEADSNRTAANLFKLILLTGMRRTEALTAKWEFVDRTRSVLVLPDTKSGEPHAVPLNGAAMGLLDGIPPVQDNPYIFASGGGHLVNPDKAWRRIRAHAGMPDLRIHDLRRTVGSMMADDNVSLHIIAGVLNHKNLSTTKVYARLGDKAPADALEKHGRAMLKVIEGGKR